MLDLAINFLTFTAVVFGCLAALAFWAWLVLYVCVITMNFIDSFNYNWRGVVAFFNRKKRKPR